MNNTQWLTIDLAVIFVIPGDHRRRDRNWDCRLAARHHDNGKTRSVRTARVWKSEGPFPGFNVPKPEAGRAGLTLAHPRSSISAIRKHDQ